ncbi:MAG: hypothetical protein KF764_20330 [Labilithrix sp.]|nr:hypothetical protein [Labilithrix sp.]MBX3223515.1 hypothetical protein [Labilithrix sp.]
MVIPQRDWLLLRGRMRAVAKIAVLPLLLTTPVVEGDDRDDGKVAAPAEDPQERR